MDRLFVLLLLLSPPAQAGEHLHFGRFASRAIFTLPDNAVCPRPLVLLVPGSGANGPEEMAPGFSTADGRDHSIFGSYSLGLSAGGLATLAIGKPGVDFFRSWDERERFYDQELYRRIRWSDLLHNLLDAVEMARQLPCVDPERIHILGHSEGTQLAVDFAAAHPGRVRSLILVGFAGESLETIVSWQLYRRAIDSWLAPDVDTNRDGRISRAEAALWPELPWSWPGDEVGLYEIEAGLRAEPVLARELERLRSLPVWQGVFAREPIYDQAARLSASLRVLTGALDVQTRPEESLRLREACTKAGKADCQVELLPGLGHAMSEPRLPRRHPLLDSTLGPVAPSFLTRLGQLARELEPR